MKLDALIRRHITGDPVTVDLGDGDSIVLHLSRAGSAFFQRGSELERAQLKDNAGEALTAAQQARINTEALVGTILTGWVDDNLVGPDGERFAARREDGSLHEEHALMLLEIPPISAAVMDHLRAATAADSAEVDRGKARPSKRSRGR